jgi:hypothetical protein
MLRNKSSERKTTPNIVKYGVSGRIAHARHIVTISMMTSITSGSLLVARFGHDDYGDDDVDLIIILMI